jgi:nucleoid-associated protein YgaU
MRKDVRFGVTIGAMLIVVLVAWVVLQDRGNQKQIPEVTLQPADSAPPPATPVLTTQAPTTQPNNVIAAAPATQPVALADDEESGTARDWTRLLASGSSTQPSIASAPPTTEPADLTPLAAVAPAKSPSSTARTYTIKSGDSFYTIAAAEYGDSSQFTRLEDANPNINPSRLRVGSVINLPDPDDSSAPVARMADSAIPARAQLDPVKSYRVHSSDTLISIARKLYGSPQDWQKIYDANRDTIGPNPARLKVDMVLRLPQRPTVAMAN